VSEFNRLPDPRLQVSVIVPVYQELSNGNIYRLLQSFAKQDADPRTFEIVFVVNNTPQNAKEKTAAFLDNQKTLCLGRYLNSDNRHFNQPDFVPDAFYDLLQEVRHKDLYLYFLDRSSAGMERNMGRIRNQGILPVISRFEAIGVDGFIANLDADTEVPYNYIRQLLYFSRLPHIKVVYPYITWRFQGTEEFLFAGYCQIILPHHYKSFCFNLFEVAQTFVGGPQITARTHVWKHLGGFPEVERGEDICFSRTVSRMDGVVSIPCVSVESQVRVREIGFMSQTLAKIIWQTREGSLKLDAREKARLPYTLIRIQFFIHFFNRRLSYIFERECVKNINDMKKILRKKHIIDEISEYFNLYYIRFDKERWEKFVSKNIDFYINEDNLKSYFIIYKQIISYSFKYNVMDFMEKILQIRDYESCKILQYMIEYDSNHIENELDFFQSEMKNILYEIYAEQHDRRKKSVLCALKNSTNKLIQMLISNDCTNIPTLISRVEKAVLLKNNSDAFNYLRTMYPDWLNSLQDTPYREDWLYLQVFEKFVHMSKHMPSTFPGMHAILVEATGHNFTTYD